MKRVIRLGQARQLHQLHALGGKVEWAGAIAGLHLEILDVNHKAEGLFWWLVISL